MFLRRKKLQQIVFEITPPVCQRIRRWQIALTQRVLEHRLTHNGRAQVVKLDGKNMISMVESLPEPGTAEIFAGTMGGTYSYRFRVGPDQLSLIVSCNVQKSFLFPEALPPLVVTIPHGVRLRHGRLSKERLALKPFVASKPDVEFISELGATFFIDGIPLDRLQQSGWNEAALTHYEYTFTPIMVGCRIVARHIESGRDHELSQGLRI